MEEKRIIASRTHVRGPIFKKVKLSLEVKSEQGAKPEMVRANIKSSLFDFFDPVYGGPDKTGYPIGRSIYNSEIIDQTEKADGVDYLRSYQVLQLNKETKEYEAVTGVLNIEYYEIIQLDMDMVIEIKNLVSQVDYG